MMLSNAIAKLKTEMEQKNSNPYVRVIGEFLLQHLSANPGSAELFMNHEKTIENSLKVMRSEAEKKKVNNFAMISDAEGFAIVLKYFGIETVKMVATTEVKPAVDFDVKLEDLL